MGDILYYDGRRKRNEFKEGLRVDTNSSSSRRQESDRVSYIGDRIAPGTPKQRLNHRRLRREAKLYYSLPEKEKIWMQKRRIKQSESKKFREGKIKGYRVSEEHKRYTALQRGKVTLMLLLAMGVGALGINAAVQANTNSQNEKQFEELAQNMDVLEQLGVSQETANEIQSLQAELSSEDIDSLSNDELLSLGRRVESAQMDVLKGKLADTLGVSEDQITITPNYSLSANESSTASVRVTKDGEETIYNTGDFLDWDNNISQEITDGILNLGDTQTVNSKVASGEFDREGAIDQYRSGVDSAKDIARKQMSIDGNGRISLSSVSQEEIDALIQNNDEER